MILSWPITLRLLGSVCPDLRQGSRQLGRPRGKILDILTGRIREGLENDWYCDLSYRERRTRFYRRQLEAGLAPAFYVEQ
jgi:hypothetical protein